MGPTFVSEDDEAALPEVPFLDRVVGGRGRRRALSPELPTLGAPVAVAVTDPEPGFNRRGRASVPTGGRPRTGRKEKRRRTAAAPGAEVLLAAIAAYDDDSPPSNAERWRRVLARGGGVGEDEELGAARGMQTTTNGHPEASPKETGTTEGAMVGGKVEGDRRGGKETRGREAAPATATGQTHDAASTTPTEARATPLIPPPPSLTWDQHAVFLQYPPLRRRRLTSELPRGLDPGMLRQLYARVEREQRRYMAHLARAASLRRAESDALEGSGPRASARAAAARWALGRGTRVVTETAPRRVTLHGSVVLVPPPQEGLTPSGPSTSGHELVPMRFHDVDRDAAVPLAAHLPPRGTRLMPPCETATDDEGVTVTTGEEWVQWDDDTTRGLWLGSLEHAARLGPCSTVMCASAFACLAANAPGRLSRAWELSVTVSSDGIVYVEGPLPSRDVVRGSEDERRQIADVYARKLLHCAADRASASAGREAGLNAPARAQLAECRLGDRHVLIKSPTHLRAPEGDGVSVLRCKVEPRVHAAERDGIPVLGGPGAPSAPGPLEEVSWEEAAEWWAALAVRPAGTTLTLVRVGDVQGTVVEVETLSVEDALRLGADPPPPPPHRAHPATEAPPPARSSVEEGGGGLDDDQGAGTGAEVGGWFDQGFDPRVAVAVVGGVLDALAAQPPGRYLLAHRRDCVAADLYREVDDGYTRVDGAAAKHTQPPPGRAATEALSVGRKGGRGRAPGRRTRSGAKKNLREGFGGVNAAEEQVDALTGEASAGWVGLGEEHGVKPQVDHDAPHALPLVGPRDDKGPSPDVVYDVHAAHRDAVAAYVSRTGAGGAAADANTAAAGKAAGGALNAEHEHAFVLPPVFPANNAQIPRTFTPRGEPPIPGARRARRMWTSLLAPPVSAGDPEVDDRGDDGAGVTPAEYHRGFPGDRPEGQDVIKGVRYCHAFAHRASCRNKPCVYPHLTIDEVLAMAAVGAGRRGGSGGEREDEGGAGGTSSGKCSAYGSLATPAGGRGLYGRIVAASVPGQRGGSWVRL